MSRWVRWSVELLMSPKWAAVPPEEFGVFSKLVLLAAVKDPPGKVSGTAEQVALAMHFDPKTVTRALERLIAYGTVKARRDGYEIVNFAQYNPAARFISAGRRPGATSIRGGSVAKNTADHAYETIGDDTKRDETTAAILAALYEARGLLADPGEDERRVERLLADYPDRDVLKEAKKAADWTATSRRPVKNFWLFFRNWLERSTPVTRELTVEERRARLRDVS